MAENPSVDKEAEEQEPSSQASDRKSLLTTGGLVLILTVLIVVHGLGFACYWLSRSSHTVQNCHEVSLGRFHFEARTPVENGISRAEFNLHIALLDQLSGPGRSLLESRQYKVQQNVEELLRQASEADFDDPRLTELKRQLQETINATLGKRVIEEVIITDLALKRQAEHPATTKAADETTATFPEANWEEKTSS